MPLGSGWQCNWPLRSDLIAFEITWVSVPSVDFFGPPSPTSGCSPAFMRTLMRTCQQSAERNAARDLSHDTNARLRARRHVFDNLFTSIRHRVTDAIDRPHCYRSWPADKPKIQVACASSPVRAGNAQHIDTDKPELRFAFHCCV